MLDQFVVAQSREQRSEIVQAIDGDPQGGDELGRLLLHWRPEQGFSLRGSLGGCSCFPGQFEKALIVFFEARLKARFSTNQEPRRLDLGGASDDPRARQTGAGERLSIPPLIHTDASQRFLQQTDVAGLLHLGQFPHMGKRLPPNGRADSRLPVVSQHIPVLP